MLAILVITVTAVTGSACVAIGVERAHEDATPRIPLTHTREQCVRQGATLPSCLPSLVTATATVGLILPTSFPVTLVIPAIGVHTLVQRIGLTPDGALAVPAPGPHYDEAAWYRHSPTPGSLGPAIIVGHLDSATDPRSVFFRLGSLHPGNRILVTRTDGLVAAFSVTDVRRYRKSQFPTSLVYGNINHAALRLITCGGPIDPATGHYRDNVIVWASLVGSTSVARTPAPSR
jgi:hypothetical protein